MTARNITAGTKPGRNDPCPCGSGRKHKQCCLGKSPATAPRAIRPSAPSNPAQSAMAEAARLLAAGQHEAAITPLLHAARLTPNNPMLLGDLGAALLQSGRPPEAITWLDRSIVLAPTHALTHYTRGLALEQLGDDEAALAAHRRAVVLNPKLAAAHGRIAHLLLLRGMWADAGAAFDQASAAAGDTSFGRVCRAKACMARDRMSDAEAELRQVIVRDPASSEALDLLGHILREAGRFDEAARYTEQAITLSPWRVISYHSLVSSKRLGEADRPLLSRVLSRLEVKNLADNQRMTLHFAAGKALDDLGDYADAMQHFDAANRIRRRVSQLDSVSRFDRREFEQRIDRLIARFTPDFFATHKGIACEDETPLLVLGMPRSGTTLIERIVSSHPKARGGGELSFWNEHGPLWVDAEIEAMAMAAPGLRDGYQALLRGIGPDALRVTDKMPFNFLWLGLVHLLFPKARVVHCRRNAIDTCLSMYSTHFAVKRWGFASDRADLAFYFRQYLRLVEHWRAVLPPDRFLDVDYEDVIRSPEESAKRLVAFSGLDWDDACAKPEKNPDVVKTASQWQVRQPIYRHAVERWRNYEPWLGELRELAPT